MLLLGTCTLLWLASDQSKLSTTADRLLADHKDALHISAISAWEIAWKQRKGKLWLPLEPGEWIDLAVSNHGLKELLVSRSVAVASALLPEHHKDPCDRILIATAQEYGLTLITPDPRIRQYTEVSVIW
jgi:PIN domain nuclease of toxin-antitoxin system